MRKTVLIPVVPLAPGPGSCLLELIVEPAGSLGGSTSLVDYLRHQGLAIAVAQAQAALRGADLLIPRRRFPLKVNLSRLGPPLLFLANPLPALSNARGATLGIAMGLLMYQGRCPGDRVLATGQLLPRCSPAGCIDIEPAHRLADKLSAALALGYQPQPLPFIVPARLADGSITQEDCREPIQALAAYNIAVIPVTRLQEAVAACWALTGDPHSMRRCSQ